VPHEFDGIAYKQSSTHQKEWGNKIIAELDLKNDSHILDLGCGDGVLTARMAELVPQGVVLGIDASQGMIEVARQIKMPNLSFELQDIDNLDYIGGFDLIYSNATLHWVKDHRKLLGNCFRALKPGGLLRFNFGGAGNCVNFIRIIRSAIEQPEYAGYFENFTWPWYFPDIKEYAALAREFPFAEVNVWEENADRYFPDADSLVKWVNQPSLVPFLAVLPEGVKTEFRTFVVEKMVSVTRQPDGRCFETFRRINVSAKRGDN
jgi:trans-aconitate methyltransferase